MIPPNITHGFLLMFTGGLVGSLFLLTFTYMFLDSYKSTISRMEWKVLGTLIVLAVITSNSLLYYAWWVNTHSWYK